MEEIKKYTYKCESCDREFDEEEFQITKDENKCILHCGKNDWFEEYNEKGIIKPPIFNRYRNWLSSDTKINLFWKKFSNFINEKINSESKEIVLDKIKFAPRYNSGDDDFPKIPMFKIKFLIFKDCIFLDCIDLTPFFSAKNLEITNCTFHENVDIQTIIHQEQFVFQKNSVSKEIKFFNIEFKSICFFVENSINKLTVEGVRFDDNAIFSNSKIENLSFKNSFFRKETNFLDMRLSKVGNRETARIIKDSFEKQNNIIEANKFYALEMKEREKELEDDLKKGKNFFEWLVFKIHGISSNHSQDWLLSLFWILNITFSLFITEKSIEAFGLNLVTFIPIITISILGINIAILNDEKIRTVFLFILSLINFGIFKIISEKNTLDCVADKINPFSIMTKGEELNFSTMIYKITIAYLIYQLIISIRQNTRRK
jgi:hypothetical protein